jgi:hypothetical protein
MTDFYEYMKEGNCKSCPIFVHGTYNDYAHDIEGDRGCFCDIIEALKKKLEVTKDE